MKKNILLCLATSMLLSCSDENSPQNLKETEHKITEKACLFGRTTLRVRNKKNSYEQFVSTPAEVRKIIEETICNEKSYVIHAKERIVRTEEKIKKLEEQLQAGIFPVVKLQQEAEVKTQTEPLGL